MLETPANPITAQCPKANAVRTTAAKSGLDDAILKARPKTALRHVMFSVYSDAARAAFKHALAGSSRS